MRIFKNFKKFSFTSGRRTDTRANHDHSRLTGDFRVICTNGDKIFRYKNTDDLIRENQLLIFKIRSQLEYHDFEFEEIFMPLIRSLARCTSIAPASACFHDASSGGLFSHSLLCALKVLELNKTKMLCHDRQIQFLLFISAIVHDLGKIISDFAVLTADEQICYSYFENIYLDDFCKRYPCSFYRIRFNPLRDKAHELKWQPFFECISKVYLEIRNTILSSDKSRHISLVSTGELSSFVSQTLCYSGQYSALLKKADIIASALSLNEHHLATSVFLQELFLSGFIDTQTEGFYKTTFGYVVDSKSKAFDAIVSCFDKYSVLLKRSNAFCSHSKNNALYQASNAEHKDLDTDNYEELLNDFFLCEIKQKAVSLISDRESIYVALSGKGFFTSYSYKTSCIWVALKKDDIISFVYGPSIDLPALASPEEFDEKMKAVRENRCYEVVSNDCYDLVTKLIKALEYDENDLRCITLKAGFSLFDIRNADDCTLLVDSVKTADENQKIAKEEKISQERQDREKVKRRLVSDVKRKVKADLSDLLKEQNDTDLDVIEEII